MTNNYTYITLSAEFDPNDLYAIFMENPMDLPSSRTTSSCFANLTPSGAAMISQVNELKATICEAKNSTEYSTADLVDSLGTCLLTAFGLESPFTSSTKKIEDLKKSIKNAAENDPAAAEKTRKVITEHMDMLRKKTAPMDDNIIVAVGGNLSDPLIYVGTPTQTAKSLQDELDAYVEILPLLSKDEGFTTYSSETRQL